MRLAGHPAEAGRSALRPSAATVALSLALTMVTILVAWWGYGSRVRIRAALGKDYAHWVDFPLRDSLPALEGGLSNLEAFRVTLSPFRKADTERALWLSDSLGRVRLEYVGEKHPFDSVLMLAWTTGHPMTARVFRTRDVAWDHAPGRSVGDWLEVVTAYVSFPPLITFRMADPRVTVFEPAEGKVSHVVANRYFNHGSRALKPDTTYAVSGPGRETGVQVVARGDALAVINPSPRAIILGVLDAGRAEATVIRGEAGRVSVFRTAMRGRTPPVLAYEDPGVPLAVFRERASAPPRLFVWPGGAAPR